MSVRRFFLGAAVLAAFALTACTNGAGTSAEPAAPAAAPLAMPAAESAHLYVANDNSRISVYSLGGTSPIRTITDGVAAPKAMVFDGAGNLYVANGNANVGGVSVYAPHTTSVLRRLSVRESVVALAIDGSGNLYVGRIRGGVDVYAPGAESPSRTITTGIRTIAALAVDSKGNLYVLNALQHLQQTGTDIIVFAPGGSKSIREYKFSVSEDALTLAFDGADNLYVGIKSTKQFTAGQVDYFEAGDASLRGRYVDLGVPAALALDATEHLYVADSKRNDVYVYRPNQRALARRLTDDLDGPASIALDKSGNVYVGNALGSSVTIYETGTKRLMQTITEGIAKPVAIAFGP